MLPIYWHSLCVCLFLIGEQTALEFPCHLLLPLKGSAILVPFSSLSTLHQPKLQAEPPLSRQHKCEFYLGLTFMKALEQYKFS